MLFILAITHNITYEPKTVRKLVPRLSKQSQKSSIQSQIFGTEMHSRSDPQTPHVIRMDLRLKINRVGEEPLPLGVCRNSPISVSTCSSCREEGLFLLLRWKLTVRSLENLEKRWSISLYFFFPLLFLSPLFFPSTNRFGQAWVK